MCAGYYVSRGPSWLAVQFDPWSPLHLIGLIAAISGLVAIFKRPEWGLLMLVALLYTNASEPAVTYYGAASPLQLMVMATAAAAAARLMLYGESRGYGLVLVPLLVPFALYAAVMFASSFGADRIGLSDDALAEHLKGILIVLVVTNLTTSPIVFRRVIWMLVLSAAFLGSISVFQVLTGSYDYEFGGFGHTKVSEIVVESREPRIAGSLSDPNFYAQILVVVIPLALYRLWDEPSPARKVVAGYALAVCTFAAVFTYSRGGMIALALVLLLALLHKRVQPKYVLLGLLIIAPISLVVPQGFSGRLDTLAQLAPSAGDDGAERQDSSFRDRKRLMTAAWQMFSDHPVLGVGSGNFSRNFDGYADHIGSSVSSFDKFGRQHFPHNLYLQIAAETGIVGLIAFASIIVVALMSLWTAYRSFTKAGAAHLANMVVSVFLAVTAFLITSLFLHGTYIRYLWLLVAISAAAGQISQRMAAGNKDV